MLVTTEACRKAIVEECRRCEPVLRAQFVPSLTPEQWKDALNPKNWKRESKRKGDSGEGTWVREFDCRPFDGQLRATVQSTDEHIYRIIVAAE